jgi:hypothetical protein
MPFYLSQSRSRCGSGEPKSRSRCAAVSPVPEQMWQGRAKVPEQRCSGEPSPGADVAAVSQSPGAEVQRGAQSRSRCGSGEPSPGADVARGEPSPGAEVQRGAQLPGGDVAAASPVAWWRCGSGSAEMTFCLLSASSVTSPGLYASVASVARRARGPRPMAGCVCMPHAACRMS